MVKKKYVWFDSPRKTKACNKNRTWHRVGVYTTFRPNDGGMDGYILRAECVECGKKLKYNGFLVINDYKKIKLMEA